MAEVVAAPVEQVELFEDRAAITRVVALPLTPGRHRLHIGPLTPLARESAIAFLPPEGAVVEEHRLHRLPPDEAAEASAELAAHREGLREEVRAVSDSVRCARERKSRVEALAAAARAWAPRALLELDEPSAWVASLRALEDARAAAGLDAELATLEIEAKREALAALDARLHPRVGERAWLEVAVLVREGGGALRVRYTVPCAVWRPAHRATLDGSRLRWEVGAMAWNATGEDWTGARLVCSTARPDTWPSPPSLADDRLRARRREKEVVVEAHEVSEIVVTGAGGPARQVDEVPGVDDGGEPRSFTAPQPVDLPSTGRPVRVFLERWDTDATVALVAHPERSEQIAFRSRHPNAGLRPVLAGPVELYREGAWVGRGRVGYVAPGATFALGWGSHDALRVTRRPSRHVERARLSGRQTHAFSVALSIVNLGDEAVEVEVRERLPVSEVSDVTVSAPAAQPALATSVDTDGVCTWRVALAPRDTRSLALSYTVEAPGNVRLPWS